MSLYPITPMEYVYLLSTVGGTEGGCLLTCCRRSSFSFTSSSVRGSAESICSCSCVCASSGSGRSGFSTAWGRGGAGERHALHTQGDLLHVARQCRGQGISSRFMVSPTPKDSHAHPLRSCAPPTREPSPAPKESHPPPTKDSICTNLVSNGFAVGVNLLLQQFNESRREELKVLYYRLLWGAGSLWAGQGGAEGSYCKVWASASYTCKDATLHRSM